MEIRFYDKDTLLGKTDELYLYSLLNIDYSKLSQQERYDQIKSKLETLKMNHKHITLKDNAKVDTSNLNILEIRPHNMTKPIPIYIY